VGDGGHVWWEDAVVYQVYPRSFADTDDDGIGDLNGVRAKLPYLAGLGVDAIWLTPFYPSPLADGGYDVSDYCAVDPRLGTLADFDGLVKEAAEHGIRVIVDLVPNHCSAEHPLFQAALAAAPGSPERDRFIFRDGDGDLPPNNWRSAFGGPAWTRVADGQWYLHLFDTSQPDWNWQHPEVAPFFADVIRFWLDRGVAGIRIDVASSMFKEQGLPDIPADSLPHGPSPHHHRAEVHDLYKSWRAILDSYPADEFPGARTAIGEVWYDSPQTLLPYLRPGGRPQVFNFQLLQVAWHADALREAIDAGLALAGGSRAPWVIGNHDVIRPVTRFGGPEAGRIAALLELALPGSAYIYQGEELGLPEITDLADEARQDPTFHRTQGAFPGRDGCRIPLPWSAGAGPAEPSWLPQPPDWGSYSVQTESEDPGSYLNLYREALRLRRELPALGAGTLRWLDSPADSLVFARDPGFVFAANLGEAPLPLPAHTEVLLSTEPLPGDGTLPPDTATWLRT
jgi:alpha-glucosidase